MTCMHCGTQLAVVHEGGAAYTEKLDQLAERTEKIEDKVDQLHRQQQIASLDREWELAQQGFLVKGKDGHTSIPSAGGAIFSCLAGIGFCILATTIGLNASEGMSGPGPGPQVIFPAFGALAAVVGIGTGFLAIRQSGPVPTSKTPLRIATTQTVKRRLVRPFAHCCFRLAVGTSRGEMACMNVLVGTSSS